MIDSRLRKLVIVATIAVFVIGAIYMLTRGERSRDLILQLEPIDPSDEITIYVGGAVSEPGLYALPRGSRLSEAVDLAGPTDDADLGGLELASRLVDEQTIVIASRSTGPGVVDDDTTLANEEADTSDARINVNSASEQQLQLLPGIGPALAERIVEHRDNSGPFQSIDELSQVSGISDRMVDELRDLAVAQP